MEGSDSLGYDATVLFVPPNVAGNISFACLRMTSNNTVTGRSEYACRTLKVKKGRSKEFGNEILTITGSLATFVNGNNLRSLTCEEFGTALEALSDELGIDSRECYVWRVEFAGTFTVDSKPPLYFPCFQARPGLHAKNMDSGVYLQNKSRTLIIHIYDKSDDEQLYDKSDDEQRNTLRLEVRQKSESFRRAIGKSYPVLASDLATPEVFEGFTRHWHKQITAVLVAPGDLPELPEKLTRKTVAQIESQLCRSNPETLSKVRQIVEAYNKAGLLDKNYRPELRRELNGPHTEPENRRLKELTLKIEALSAPFLFEAPEGFTGVKGISDTQNRESEGVLLRDGRVN